MAQQERVTHSTKKQATEVDTPKGTALILAIYAALISILWGAMYFELILRR